MRREDRMVEEGEGIKGGREGRERDRREEEEEEEEQVHKMAKKSLRIRHCSHCPRPGIVNIAGGGLEPRPVMLTMPGFRQCEQCLIR
ncbi:hypothetical protein M0804_006669 [Polistes exclamans]|nr:hypothetical protein M0804_006669 [Polistes exclamans]